MRHALVTQEDLAADQPLRVHTSADDLLRQGAYHLRRSFTQM